MSIRMDEITNMSFSNVVTGELLEPVSPGNILSHDFMEPMGLSANALAQALGVPTNRVTAILKGARGVTADTACRLGIAFDTTAEFWMNLQTQYELETVQRGSGEKITHEVHRLAA